MAKPIQSTKAPRRPGRRFLGCGCNTWLLGFALFAILFVVLVSLSDTGDDIERSVILPTLTQDIGEASTPTAVPTPAPTVVPLGTAQPAPPPTATAALILLPTATPATARSAIVPDASLSDCECSANTLNCGDFSDPFDAQACYLRCLQTVGFDVHELDRDSDGNACEWDR